MSEKEEKIRYYSRYGWMWVIIQFVLMGMDLINMFVFQSTVESQILFITLVTGAGVLAVYNFKKEEKLKKQV